MKKLGTIALSALLMVSGSAALAKKPQADEIRYCDSGIAYNDTSSGNAYTENITITHSSKSTDTHTLALKYPTYDYYPAKSACAAVGAGNVIGFYDRYDENLIPNHTSGRAIGNTYMYNAEDDYVRATITSLYNYMGASTTGTTEKQFKNGITDFCSDKGHGIVFSSCMSGSSFDYSKAQSYLESNQPIILFLEGYNVVTVSEGSSSDSLSIYGSDAAHIMIAFGYKTYYYSGSRTYQYLSVSSGVSGHTSGLFNISYKTKINNALAVKIT